MTSPSRNLRRASAGRTAECSLIALRPGWGDESEPHGLTGAHLGGPIDVGVDDDGRHRVAAGHRVVREEQHRIPVGRHLDRSADHTLAGQLTASRRGRSRSPSSRMPTRSLRSDAVQTCG